MSIGSTFESEAAARPGDLVRIAKTAEVDEQPREGREVERTAHAECLRQGSEHRRERAEELRGALGEWTLGLDVQNTDDGLADAQRDRKLRAHGRQRAEVVGIGVHVRRELLVPEPDGPAHDALLDPDAVGDDRIAALRDQPQPAVLEHEERRIDRVDRVVERADGVVDRLLRLGCSLGRGDRLLHSRRDAAWSRSAARGQAWTRSP